MISGIRGAAARGTTGAAEATKGYATPQEALATQQGLLSAGLQNVEANLSPEEIEYQKHIKERRTGLPEKQRRAEKINEALAWLEAGSTVGGLGTAAIAGGKKYMLGQADIQKTYDDLNDNLVKQSAEMKKGQRAEAKGDIEKAQGFYDKATQHKLAAQKETATLQNTLKAHEMDNISREKQAQIHAAVQNAPTALLKEQLQRYEREMTAENAAKGLPPPTLAQIQERMTTATKQGDESVAAANKRGADKLYQEFLSGLMSDPFILKDVQKAVKGDKEALARVEAYKQKRKDEIYGTTPAQTAPPAQNNSLVMDGYAFPDQKSLDAYKAAKAKQR